MWRWVAFTVLIFSTTGCMVNSPSPFHTGSLYEAEINSESARLEVFFPWASKDEVEQDGKEE